MSWQESYRRSYPCNCGKGTITLVGESDDWNRSRESEYNSCKDCVEKDRLLKQQKATYQEDRDNRIVELSSQIKSTIQNSYSNDWLVFTARFKSKKSVHKFITENKLDHISESSFYQHNRNKSTYECVEQLLQPKNYDKIISSIINNPDKELNDQIQEIESLYQDQKGERINEMYREYRGR